MKNIKKNETKSKKTIEKINKALYNIDNVIIPSGRTG